MPTSISRAWGAAAAFAVLTSAPLALADVPQFPECTKEPTKDEVKGAIGAHTAAEAFFNQNKFDEAIKSWMSAYALDCTAHRLLVNIANAYEGMGDKKAAIAALEAYLVRDPKGTEVEASG